MKAWFSTKVFIGACVVVSAVVSGAAAQQAGRLAVSPALSPQDAGEAFEQTVMDVCVNGVSSGRRVAQLTAARENLSQSDDPQTRQQAGAGDDETVWDVQTARGVVTVKEKAGRCAVSVYGPPAGSMMIMMAAKLTNAGFERMAVSGNGGLSQSLRRVDGDRQVQVMLTGSDPGSPGHTSRFSVVTATVFDMAAK